MFYVYIAFIVHKSFIYLSDTINDVIIIHIYCYALPVPVPPKSLEISLNPEVVKAGQLVTITCRSSSSNPASVLSWWKGGDKVVGVIDGGNASAEHGGLSTESRLELTPTVEDHGAIYSCRATNTVLEQAVSDAVTLNVLCEYLAMVFALQSVILEYKFHHKGN